MTPYLILSRDAPNASSETLIQSVRATIDALQSDWRLLMDGPAALIAVERKGRVIAGPRQVPATFIVGDIFPRVASQRAIDGMLAADLPFPDLCRQLVRDWWGAYLAVQIRGCGDMSVFRDPVGMRDGLCWAGSGGFVFASQAMPWLAACVPSGLAIDWTRIAQLLRDSSTAAEATPLLGVETIAPGSLIDLCDGRKVARRLWFPRMFDERRAPHDADHRRPARDRHPMHAGVGGNLSRQYAGDFRGLRLGGRSGGRDDACRGNKARHQLLHRHLSGDERRYAREISTHRAIPLDEIYAGRPVEWSRSRRQPGRCASGPEHRHLVPRQTACRA
jgi:asparagine synthase (glutamine-hydrolysing)